MTNLNRALCLFLLLLLATCVNKEIPSGPNCDVEPVVPPTTVITDATSCTASDGTIEVTAVGGIGPFMYQLGTGTFVANPLFTALTAGSYVITVKDSRGCTNSATAVVHAAGSTLDATIVTTADNQCFAPHDGTITITPSGGTPPYEVKFGNGGFDIIMTFDGLEEGVYPVTVKDAAGCLLAWNCTVHHGDTGTSYENEIAPILNVMCNSSSCHGAGNGPRNFTNYANVAAKAQQIKLRTGNGSMPPAGQPDLTPQQIQLIACWVDDGAKNN
jgi:hypothetical protein